MKNYFNEEERMRHIYMMYLQIICDDTIKSQALTADERKWLKTASTYIAKFSGSVFLRFGNSYYRKVRNTVACNEMRIRPRRYDEEGKIEVVTKAASEDLIPKITELQTFNCFECNKTDWKDCAVYGISVACGIEGHDTDSCPYKLD